MADATNALKVDTSSGVSSIQKLLDQFRKLNTEMINIRVASAALNKENNVVVATLLSSDKAGNKFLTTIRSIDGVLTSTKTTVTAFENSLDSARNAKERLNEALKSGIPKDFATVPASATAKERAKYDTAVSNLINTAAKAPDQLGPKQIETLFITTAAGSKKTYSGVVEDARQAVVKVIEQYGKLGNAAKEAEAKQKLAISAATGIIRLQDVFGPVRGDATKSEIEKVNRALISFKETMISLRLNAGNQLTSALASFNKGELGKTDSLEKLRQSIFDVYKAYESVGTVADKTAKKVEAEAQKQVDAENKVQTAIVARQQIEKSLSAGQAGPKKTILSGVDVSINTKPSVDELLKLSTALDRLQAKIQASKTGAVDFNIAASAKTTDPLSASQRTILKLIEDIRSAYRSLGTESQLTADKQIENNKRVATSVNVRRLVEANLGSINIFSSVAEIDKLRAALDKVQTVFIDNKLAAIDFEVVLDAIKTDSVSTLEQKYRRLAQAIIEARTAHVNLGESERQAKREDFTKNLKQETGRVVVTRLEEVFNPIGIQSSLTELEKYRRAVTVVQGAIESSKHSIRDFELALNAVQAGSTGGLNAEQQKLRQSIIAVREAYKGLGQEARATSDKQEASDRKKTEAEERIANALKIRGQIESGLFGKIDTSASSNELKAFRADMVAVQRAIEQGRISFEQFNRVAAQFGSGGGGGKPPVLTVAPAPGDDERAISLISKLIERQQQLGQTNRDQAAAEKKFAEDKIANEQRIAQAIQLRKQIEASLGPITTGDSGKGYRELQATLTGVQTKAQRSAESLANLNAVVIGIKIPGFEPANAQQSQFLDALRLAQQRYDTLQKSAQAALDKIVKETNDAASATKLLNQIEGVKTVLSGDFIIKPGSDAEIIKFLNDFNKIPLALAKGKIAVEEYLRAREALKADNLASLSTPGELKSVQLLKQLEGSYRDIGKAAEEAKQKSENIAVGTKVQNFAKKFFDVGSLAGSEVEINRVNTALIKLREYFADGTKSGRDFATLQNAIKTGNIDNVTGSIKQLRAVWLELNSAVSNVGTESQTASDKAIAALEKQARATQKARDEAAKLATQQALKSQRGQAGEVASGLAQQAFGPVPFTANISQVQTFRNQIAAAVQSVEKGKVSLNEFSAILNRVLSGDSLRGEALTGAMGNVERHLQSANASFVNIANSGATAGDRINRTWLTVNNLFRTLVIGDVIGRMLRSFEQAVTKAADFQISIGLLLTLSQDAPSSFNDWAASIRAVSNELGKPITDVATAAYDALSNQVIESADDFEKFGRQVGKLAIITRSDLKSSIDAVSGVLNSFNLNINSTSRVTSLLFKSIDLGKITMSQLSDTMGRLGPIVNELGIDISEFLAFLTSTSRAGISVDVAMTQVGQVLNALLKPNKELLEFFRSIGAESGEQAIAINGFTGVLQKLKDATGGSAEKLATMFPELRGLRGVVSVLRNDFKEFTGDLDKLRNQATQSADEAGQIFNKNPGQKFREELEKIRNFFLEQWETVVLKDVLKYTEYIGGVSGAIRTLYNILLQLIIPITTFSGLVYIGFRITSVATFIASVANATAGVQILSATLTRFGITAAIPFGPLGIALAGVAAAFVAIKINSSQVRTQLVETAKAIDSATSKRAQDNSTEFQQNLDKQVQATKQSVEAQGQAYAQLPAKIRSALNSVLDVQREKTNQITESVKQNLDILLSSIRNIVSELRRAREQSQKFIDDSPKTGNDFVRKVAQSDFERTKQNIEQSPLGEVQKQQLLLNLLQQRLAKLDEERRANIAAADPTKDNSLLEEKINKSFEDRLDVLNQIADIRHKDLKSGGQAGGLDVEFNRETASLHNQKSQTTDPNLKAQIDRQLAGIKQLQVLTPKGFDIVGGQAVFDISKEILKTVKEEESVRQRMVEIEKERIKLLAAQEEEGKRQVQELTDLFEKITKFSFIDEKGDIKKKFIEDRGAAKREFDDLVNQLFKKRKPITDLVDFTENLNLRRAVVEEYDRAIKEVEKRKIDLSAEVSLNVKKSELGKLSEKFLDNKDQINKSVDEASLAVKKIEEEQGKLIARIQASGQKLGQNAPLALAGDSLIPGVGTLRQALVGAIGPDLPITQAVERLDEVLRNFSPERISEIIEAHKALEKELQEHVDPFLSKKGLDTVLIPGAGESIKDQLNKSINTTFANLDPAKLEASTTALNDLIASLDKLSKQDTDKVLNKDILGEPLRNTVVGLSQDATAQLRKNEEARLKRQQEINDAVSFGKTSPQNASQLQAENQQQFVDKNKQAIAELKKEMQSLREASRFQAIPSEPTGITVRQTLESAKEDIQNLVALSNKFAEAQQELKTKEQDATRIGASGFEAIKVQVDQSADSIRKMGKDTVSAMTEANRITETLEQTFKRINDEAINFNLKSPVIKAPTVDHQATGGVIRRFATGGIVQGFSDGGFLSDFFSGRYASGIDNIPIMATRGESIINPVASRRFYTQIQAINQNRQPLYRNESTVTNVGDINIKLDNTNSTAAKTARQIGLELRRELRRGNLR